MKYEDWKKGELNKEWKQLFPNLWDAFVKDKYRIDRLETLIRCRMLNLENWWKDTGEDHSGELHFLKEILEKLVFIGNMVTAQKMERED